MELDPSAFVADPELIQALGKRSTTIQCGGDRVLFRQGDAPAGVYIINKGEATVSMDSPEGDAVLSIQAAAGSLLGLPGLIGNKPYTLTAVACKDAEVGFVNREDFASLMQTEPLLSLKILEVLAAEVRSARRAISNL
jgi:CRP-like cAMP-binding protein